MGYQTSNGDDHHRRNGPALLGREPETAALRAVLTGQGATAAVVAVVGDPGIGKTRLLADLMAQARNDGRTVLAGRAAEFEREVPFGVLRNAMEDHLRGLPGPWRGRLDGAHLRLLPAVFPTLTAAAGRGDESGLLAGERYRLHRAVRALLENIAGDGLVLALDDLHWADESSIELLDHLLRHPPRAPVLLAGAYRPRQASARLDHAMAGAVQRGLATVISVGPLAFAEAGGLLPPGLSPTQRQELYEAGGGNPFYLQVLARSPDIWRSVTPADAGGSVPPPVQAALASEFATLEPQCQRVVHAAAVAGDEFDAGLLSAVAVLAEPAVLAALDELVQRDLVRVNGMPGAFRFRHPLLRSAAYHHAGAGWRVAAHARAAAELAARGAPVEVRAGHIAASALVGDLASVEVLRAAAVDVMHASPAAAAHWLASALRLLPEDPACTGLRLQLLQLRANVAGVTGRLAESRDLIGEILHRLAPGTEQRATVAYSLALVEHLLGNHAQSRAVLMRELAALPDQNGTDAGTLRVGLAVTSVMYGPADPAAVVQAIDMARGTDSRALLAVALGVGAVATHSFDVADPRAARWLDEAAELVDAMSDREFARRLDTVMFLGWGEFYLERYGAARRHLERALQIARATGQSHIVPSVQTLLAVVGCSTGQLSWALAHLDDAWESAELSGGPQARARVLVNKCWISIWQGELEEALAYGKEAAAVAAGGESPEWEATPAEVMLGLAHHAAGDHLAGLELMARTGHERVRPVWQARWYEALAAVAAAAGDEAGAVEWATRAVELPVVEALPRRAGLIHLAQVHATLHGDPAAALGHAQRAAESLRRGGDRLGAAQAHLYAGVAYRSLGDAAAAEREISIARRGFADCGASPHWLAERCGVELAVPPANEAAVALASGPTPAGAAPELSTSYQLTPRELGVLRLLAESLTAAAIARRLGISPGTVHKHLARLYRKLGTGDRLATVLLAREAGLLADPATEVTQPVA